MCNTEIGYFCMQHDNWEDLLTQEPYNLKIKRDGDYVMFSYDQIRSDFTVAIVREARGIIFREGQWQNPVCWAFDKFGNYGEPYVPTIKWSTAVVTEKVDGSLIKVWYDNSVWHVSTNGTIDAVKAELGGAKYASFGAYFLDTIYKYYECLSSFFDSLDKDLTYMFELVGPYNRVVVPYEQPAIYFLGARNKFNGNEYPCSPLIAGSLNMGRFKLPKMFKLTSLDACLKAVEEFNWDQEGFVVSDADGNRVKVKSPSYVLAHYTRNNNVITRKHLIRVILANEVAEFLCYASDYEDCLFDCQKLINTYYNVGNTLASACRKARSMPRSAYAGLVKSFPEIFHGLLFLNYDRDVTVEEYTSKWNENKWEEYLERIERLINEYSNI